MRLHRILPLLTAAILIMPYAFPVIKAKAETISENSSDILSEEDDAPEPESVSGNHSADSSDEDAAQEPADMPLPAEAPGFSATLEHCSDGYIVKGHFSEFLPDTIFVQPQSSLDGEYWQDCGIDWHLSNLGDEDPDSRYALENQICLYETFEPLKSYLDGSLNRFWLRLLITRENGDAYKTQAAVIELGETMPVPEEITLSASFAPTMLSYETTTSGSFIYSGKYQLTVRADASSEEIAAYLPNTLPVQVELKKGRNPFTKCIINCPVTWKSLPLSGLTAGESVSIQDAAEEIVIPAGTELSTPAGKFTLNEPLNLESNWWITDEVILVLNVIPENGNPTGVLAINNNELKMAFDLKPTGATAIRAYTLVDGESEWTELSGLPLLNAVNAQPLTANSGYTDILSSSQEPYRSYLAAEFAGEKSRPFFVGLKIEGGVYNGCELILACPNTYDLPPNLHVGGSGGNEGNAGNGNRDDSTEEGQRPNLPKPRPDKTSAKEPQPNTPAAPADSSENNNSPSGTGTANISTGTGTQAQADISEHPAAADAKSQTGPSKISTDTGTKPQGGSSEISADGDAKSQSSSLKIAAGTDTKLRAQTSVKSPAGSSEISSDIDAQPQKKQTNPVMLFLAAAMAFGGVCLCVRNTGVRKALKTWQQNHGGNGKTARL